MKVSFQRFLTDVSVGAGDTLLKYFRKKHRIQRKPLQGIVTEADKASETYILRKISRAFPESTIITEESGEYPGKGALCWIIDPLDGTTNYAHGFPWFCVSIGLYEGDRALAGAVYQPVGGELFLAEAGRGTTLNGKRVRVSQGSRLRDAMVATGFYYSSKGPVLRKDMSIYARMNSGVLGLRRFGAAALDIANVACGRVDGFWQRGLSSWDVAAGFLLVEEAGGKVTDFKGKPTSVYAKEVVASNAKLHRSMLNRIRT